jgi:glutamate carboxypeptidase
LGIGVEPALPTGGVAAARKGSLTAHLVVAGVAAHVGRAHREGRSAIRALAGLIERLETHNDRPGVTVNCGRVTGGGALNIVPDRAVGSFNVRIEGEAERRWIEARFAEAAEECPLPVEVHWTGARPPKTRTPALDRLLSDVTEAGALVGIDIVPEDTGGCCDGNNLAAAGLPNVDSLGIAGGGIHSPDEFADVASVPGRAAVILEVIRRAAARSAGGGQPDRPDGGGEDR